MSDHQSPQLHRPGESLPISIELLKLAEVIRKDVLRAVEQWEDNPPFDKYADILGAREDA